MNIKTASKKLENFYEEVKGSMPLTVLPNKAVGYKDFVIRQRKDGSWDLTRLYGKRLQVLDNFNLKTTAIISARYYEINNIQQLIETKELDRLYWNAHTDSVYFKHFYAKTQDSVKKDNYLWRYELTTQKATYYKDKISSTFRTVFR